MLIVCYSVSLNMLTINVHWSLLLTLSQDGFAALHVACQEGHYQVAELLLQAGASVEQETNVRCWCCIVTLCLWCWIVHTNHNIAPLLFCALLWVKTWEEGLRVVKAYPILILAQFFLYTLYLEQVLMTEYMLSIIDQPISKWIVVCYKQLLPS